MLKRTGSAFTLLFLAGFCQLSSTASELTSMDAAKIAQYGIQSFNKGDYQNAIRYLSARARMKPEDASIYYYLGNSYLKTNQSENAAHMFSASVRVDPASQAGKYSLSALETLSTMPRNPEPAPAPAPEGPDPAQTAANKDALMSEAAIDKAFNDAVEKIKGKRQTLKSNVDHIWLKMQDEMQSLTQKNNPNFAADLEKLQREAEIKVQDMQTKQLRMENRMMAPDKIDVRAIPQLPGEKLDTSKTALGSLLDYFKPEKPFDPFATDITPELTSKFLTVKDVFGELPTYQGSARKLAKQVFAQLKSSIEMKQDMLDQQLFQLKSNLLHDVINTKINYGNQSSQKQASVTASSFITAAKLPRQEAQHLSPMEIEVHQAVERSKKRIKELEETYNKDVDSLIAGAKEKLGGMIAQTGQMNSQLKKPSGNIQLVPLGTDMYTRNYVNFGDGSATSAGGANVSAGPGAQAAAAGAVPLRAEAKRLPAALKSTQPLKSQASKTPSAAGSGSGSGSGSLPQALKKGAN